MTPPADAALAAPPVRPHPAAPRRSGRLRAAPDPGPGAELPTPPSPPFERIDDGWEATVPGRLGSKTTVAVTTRGVRLGGTWVGFDEVAHATVSLGSTGDKGVHVRYALETYRGRPVRLHTRALRSGAGDALYDVADHVWVVLRAAVAPRLRAPLVDAVGRGETVELAGLLLGPEGMAAARRPDVVVPWRYVGDPVVERRRIVVPAGVKVLSTPLASRDAVLLLDLPAEIRTRRLRTG